MQKNAVYLQACEPKGEGALGALKQAFFVESLAVAKNEKLIIF